MIQVSPFRLTQEDLPDLDSKTAAGLEPLLDALNVTLQQLVANSQATPVEQFVDVSLITDFDLSQSFPITFKHSVPQPRSVVLSNIVPKDPDHDLSFPFVMQGFSLTDGGLVSVPAITGLLPLNSYRLTFWVR